MNSDKLTEYGQTTTQDIDKKPRRIWTDNHSGFRQKTTQYYTDNQSRYRQTTTHAMDRQSDSHLGYGQTGIQDMGCHFEYGKTTILKKDATHPKYFFSLHRTDAVGYVGHLDNHAKFKCDPTKGSYDIPVVCCAILSNGLLGLGDKQYIYGKSFPGT